MAAKKETINKILLGMDIAGLIEQMPDDTSDYVLVGIKRNGSIAIGSTLYDDKFRLLGVLEAARENIKDYIKFNNGGY